jgi:hypothetical protein
MKLDKGAPLQTQDHISHADTYLRRLVGDCVWRCKAGDINYYGCACAILHEDLGYWNMCANWVLRQLTKPHKQHMVVSTRFLQFFWRRSSFIEQIVTGDETWVHRFDPASKWQSVEWKHPTSTWKNKMSTQLKKRTCFWDMNRPVSKHYQVKGQT